MAQVAKEVPAAIAKCKSVLSDFENLIAAIKAIDSPKTYFFRLEKDIVVNHV